MIRKPWLGVLLLVAALFVIFWACEGIQPGKTQQGKVASQGPRPGQEPGNIPPPPADETFYTPGKEVLCVYKNSMERERLYKNVFPIIKRLGLVPVALSIHRPPSVADLAGKRAVLSWSSVTLYDHSQAYLDFLCEAVDQGKKVILIGGLGAYGSKKGDKETYLGNEKYNVFFNRIGLHFAGYWTNNPAVLRVKYKNRSMVEHKYHQSPKDVKHYFQIVNNDNRNTVHLIVERTDWEQVKGMKSGDSAFTVTGPFGGYCLEFYEGRWHRKKYRQMLNLEKFIKASLYYKPIRERYLVVYDGSRGDEQYRFFLENVRRALQLAKINYLLMEKKFVENTSGRDYDQFSGVLFALWGLKDTPVQPFEEYVKNGGILLSLGGHGAGPFKSLFGIREQGEKTDSSYLVHVRQPLLLLKQPFRELELYRQTRKVVLKPGATIFWEMESDLGRHPAVWSYRYGKGRTLYWNSNGLGSTRNDRALIVESLRRVTDTCFGGVVNLGMMWMDDCPAPVWDTDYKKYYTKILSNQLRVAQDQLAGRVTRSTNKLKFKKLSGGETIKIKKPDKKTAKGLQEKINNLKLLMARLEKNYPDKQLDSEFMEKTWVPEFFGILKKHKIPMSFYVIFNYNMNLEPPFDVRDFFLSKSGLPMKLARKILAEGHEMGLHGMNHQSLTVERTALGEHSKPWDKKNIFRVMQAGREAWDRLFGKHTHPVSYVAPHNVIDGWGILALRKYFPSITVIGTLYQKGEYESDMDFGWNGNNPAAFNIPRASSGFAMTKENRNNVLFLASHIGVVSHFMHPDDYIDADRSFGYQGWPWMRRKFEEMIVFLKQNYPWMEWFQVRDAAPHFIKYTEKKVLVTKEDGVITVSLAQSPQERPFYFRITFNRQRFRSAEDCEVVERYNGGRDIIFKTSSPISRIRVR